MRATTAAVAILLLSGIAAGARETTPEAEHSAPAHLQELSWRAMEQGCIKGRSQSVSVEEATRTCACVIAGTRARLTEDEWLTYLRTRQPMPTMMQMTARCIDPGH